MPRFVLNVRASVNEQYIVEADNEEDAKKFFTSMKYASMIQARETLIYDHEIESVHQIDKS